MKIVLAHDYLTQRGGAERVALCFTELFPEARLVTSLYDPVGTYPGFRNVRMRLSFLNRFGFLRRNFRAALPLFPLAYEVTPVPDDVDVVLVSTTGFAHGIRTAQTTRKVVFCHSPPRFLYLVEDYLGRPWWRSLVGWPLMLLRPALVWWDQRAARSADVYLCNSIVVKRRIKEIYGLDATVIHPPAALDPVGPQEPLPLDDPQATSFYVIVSRLMPYKNVDVVVDAFRRLPDRHLLVIGRGPLWDALRRNKPANVTMAQDVSDAELRWAYANAEAVIAPGQEDFGLTPVEGFQFGTPTVALRAGGYLDTVVDGLSGRFFEEPEPEQVAAAIRALEAEPLDPTRVREHGRNFSRAAFDDAVTVAVTRAVEDGAGPGTR